MSVLKRMYVYVFNNVLLIGCSLHYPLDGYMYYPLIMTTILNSMDKMQVQCHNTTHKTKLEEEDRQGVEMRGARRGEGDRQEEHIRGTRKENWLKIG